MSVSLSPEQWEQVQRLFEEVVDLPPEMQSIWLDQVCGDDAIVREEIESMLGTLPAEVPSDQVRQEMPWETPTISRSAGQTGRRIAQYDVLERLGKGGMGEVYKAHDTKLGRDVALKFLPDFLRDDAQARARFVHEARAASALDHPNIGTIYEIGEAGPESGLSHSGQLFIAMALYEGETLKQRLARGSLPVETALDYTVQIAHGLAKAHAAGIVHRDIKPANVMLTEPDGATGSGLLKIVDFGLAKSTDVHLTRQGTTLGTAAYMSPEQARGVAVDHRTDLWSLGVVLYEMLTGERPFKGEYADAIIYNALQEEPPPLRALKPDVPEDLEHIVRLCLEKDPDHRYPSMADLLADLEMLQHGDASALSSRRMTRPTRAFAIPRNVLFGLGLIGLSIVLVLAVPALRNRVPGLGGATLPDQRFLAVLPFDNVGSDPENQAFIDGLVYTMTTKLAEMEQFQDALSVVPARDVLQAGQLSTREVADQFKVNLVLSGSVQRTDRNVRITLQLIDPSQEKVLSSRSLDAPMVDIAALQDGVVTKLAELIDLELNPASQQLLTAGQTSMPEAFDYYTRALGYLQHFEDVTNIEAAVSLFALAVKEDTTYALAYAGLGEAYLRKYQESNEAVWIEEAIRNGEKAVTLNAELAPAHVTLGMIYADTGRDEQSEMEYLRALALEPKNASAHHALGWVFAGQEKPQEAEASFKRAIALKPGYWLYANDLGQFYHAQGQHEAAITQFERVIALQPDNPWGYNNIGVQYNRLGRIEDAVTWYEQAIKVNPKAVRATAFAYYNLGGMYYAQDRFGEAAQTYEQALKLQETNMSAWENLGDAHFWSGDREAARTAWLRTLVLAQQRLVVDPSDVETLGSMAEVYARLGLRDSTLVYITRMLSQGEPSAATLFSVAQAHEILGDREQALMNVNAALEQGRAPATFVFSAWFDALRADARYQQIMQVYQKGS